MREVSITPRRSALRALPSAAPLRWRQAERASLVSSATIRFVSSAGSAVRCPLTTRHRPLSLPPVTCPINTVFTVFSVFNGENQNHRKLPQNRGVSAVFPLENRDGAQHRRTGCKPTKYGARGNFGKLDLCFFLPKLTILNQ
jgi:hypothetical protein